MANDERTLPLRQHELDEMKCGTPGCECSVVILCGRCHPRGGVKITYDRHDGVLTLTCAVCAHAVAQIEVAP